MVSSRKKWHTASAERASVQLSLYLTNKPHFCCMHCWAQELVLFCGMSSHGMRTPFVRATLGVASVKFWN